MKTRKNEPLVRLFRASERSLLPGGEHRRTEKTPLEAIISRFLRLGWQIHGALR
mgnify:CR=1 FL=1